MTWAQNATTKVWTNTGAGSSVVVATTAFPGGSVITLSVPKPSYNVKVIVPGSVDGRTRYEAGIEGANVVVRRVAFGVVGSNLTNSATDTPPGAPATTAHGLPANVPLVLDVRDKDGQIEVRLNGTLFIRHTIDTADYYTVFNAYANLRYYGFVSEVDGAVISKAEISPLVQSEPTPMTEIMAIVCDGNLIITEDGVNSQVVAAGVFGKTGLVSMVEYQRKVWMIGTGIARVFDPDPSALSVSAWTASSGTFPGSSGLPAGQTRCTILTNFLDRLFIAGDPVDPQNGMLTAVGDATNMDTAADNSGRAFELATGLTGRIGQPLTCATQAANGVLILGCVAQIWRFVGDPALGTPSLTPASLSSGLTGKDSAALADASTLIAHSPDGAFTIGSAPGEPAIPLSAPVLSAGLELDRETAAAIYQIVVRDPGRKLTYFFMTPVVSGACVHYVYDEVVGKFTPERGGWFEDVYDPSIGPTAACMFRGNLVLGTRDGRVLYYDDDATADDGEAFVSNAPLTLADPKMSNHDAILVDRVSLVLGDGSDPVQLRVYRGRTAEEAMVGSVRSRAWSREVPARGCVIRQTVSAPALSFELYSNDADRGWELESLSIDYTTLANGARHGWKTPTPGRAPCTIHTDTTSGSEDGPGGGTSSTPYVEFETLLNASVTALYTDTPDPNLIAVTPPGDGGLTLDGLATDTDASSGVDVDEF